MCPQCGAAHAQARHFRCQGHGTSENDRPPIIGTFGRESGQVRLAVITHTDKPTLQQHVTAARQAAATCYTDEWRRYEGLPRPHATICHGQHEGARDDDGDGIREVQTCYAANAPILYMSQYD